MAEAGISSLGITLWVAESTDGTKVTEANSYTKLSRINQISEVTVEPETIDASALEDLYTKNITGRSTVSDTLEITVNDTSETQAEWEKYLGKKVCFLIKVPGKTKQDFIIATVPEKIPSSSFDQNALLTFTMNCTVNDFIGWDTAVAVEVEE